MVYDMQNNQFALDLNNVHSVLEIGQVCITDVLYNCVSAAVCELYINTLLYIYIIIFIIYVYINMHLSVCLHIHPSIYIYTYIYVCVYIYLYVYKRIIYMCVCV